MKQLIFLLVVFSSFLGISQEEKDTIIPDVSELPPYTSWMYNSYETFGIYPELQYVKGPVIGLSASFAHVVEGEGGGSDIGINAGFDYAPIQRFYGPKVSLWADVLALFLPGNATVNVMYYFQDGKKGWYCRPEIGIGIPRLHLKYGFGFRMAGDELTGVSRHSISLGYHVSLIKSPSGR